MKKAGKIKPGKGHEEIITSFSGNLKLTGHHNVMLEEGEAIHLADEQTCFLENIGNSEIVYIIAGGHWPATDINFLFPVSSQT